MVCALRHSAMCSLNLQSETAPNRVASRHPNPHGMPVAGHPDCMLCPRCDLSACCKDAGAHTSRRASGRRSVSRRTRRPSTCPEWRARCSGPWSRRCTVMRCAIVPPCASDEGLSMRCCACCAYSRQLGSPSRGIAAPLLRTLCRADGCSCTLRLHSVGDAWSSSEPSHLKAAIGCTAAAVRRDGRRVASAGGPAPDRGCRRRSSALRHRPLPHADRARHPHVRAGALPA